MLYAKNVRLIAAAGLMGTALFFTKRTGAENRYW